MSTRDIHSRCRLVLVLSGEQLLAFGDQAPAIIENACSGGDVASVIFAQNTLDEAPFLEAVKPCVEAAQKAEAAAIIAGDARVAGRLGADGIQYGQDAEGVLDGVEQYSPKFMIGAGNIRTRHNALIIGEAQPDYVMFGKAGGDTQEKAHPRNIDLGQWWAAMIEIPAIVMGGSSIDSLIEASQTKAEFVGLGYAIFGPKEGPMPALDGNDSAASRVAKANALLDQHAPILEDAEDEAS